MLGKRVLGVEGAAAQREKEGVPAQGVVAVRLGKRLLGGARPVAATANRVAPPKAPVTDEKPVKGKKKSAPKTVAFTEAEVEAQLAADANVWDTVLDAESKRPEGPRIAVAALILAAAERAETNPIPESIVQELERIVAGTATE